MAQEGNLWFNIGADNTQFAKAANDTNKRLGDMSRNVKEFATGMSASFKEAAKQMLGFYSVAKAGTMFQELINKNDEFSKSMREVSTLSEDVAKNLDSYKQQILDMTTDIPIAANDAAKALYQINSAGHTGAAGMRVLEASAKAAIGGVTDTLTAADTITTVLNAYKMSADDAASVSDKLFTAVRLGKTTMAELGASISQVAPLAATYGISIDQVLAAVATLTKNGTSTGAAFTQIRAAIVSLADELGTSVFQTKTLQEAMIELRNTYSDTNKLKDAMGRIEGVNAVLAMTGDNAAGAAADLREFAASAGAADDAYGKMNTGKGVELTRLQNNILKSLYGVNTEISEVIERLAKVMNEAFDTGQIDRYLETVKEIAVAYGAYKAVTITLAAAQKAYNVVLEEYNYQQALANVGQKTYIAGQELGTASTIAITGAQAAQSTVMGLLSRAWQKLTAAMAANPVGIWIVALGALAGIIYNVVEKAKEAREALKDVTEGTDEFGRSADAAKEANEALNDSYKRTKSELVETISRLKAFQGSKEEEQKLIKEVNDKYGDAMGYYQSVEDWYKVLTAKSEVYCKQLMYEAEIRQLANRAAEIDMQKRDLQYNEDGSMKTYDANKKRTIKGYTYNSSTGAGTPIYEYTDSDADIAMKNMQNLDKKLQNVTARMEELHKKSAEAAQSIASAVAGTTRGERPQGGSGAKNNPEEAAKAAEKAKQLLEKQKEARETLGEQLLDMEQKNEDARIELMRQGHERRMAELNNEYRKEIEEIRRQAVAWGKDNQNAGYAENDLISSIMIGGESYGGLTSGQMESLREGMAVAYRKMAKGVGDLMKAEGDDMNSYLRAYGTPDQKENAIIEYYTKQIEEASTDGMRMSLERKMQEAVNQVRFDELKKQIDWEFVFGDMENAPDEVLEGVISKLKEFKDSVKDLKPEDMKAVVEAMERIRNLRGSGSAAGRYKEARSEYRTALGEFQSAKTDEDKIKSYKKLQTAQKKMDKAWNDGMQTASNYGQALGELGDAMGGAAGECLQLASAAIGAGVGMANGIKAFGEAMSALERSVAILAIIEAALKAVQMLSDLFGGTDATLVSYVETMDTYIDLLGSHIDDLNDSMNDTKNTMRETIEYYRQLVDLEKESAAAIKSQSQVWLNSGASGGFLGIGSKASEGMKISKQIAESLASSNAEVRAFYRDGFASLNRYFKEVEGYYASSAEDFGRMDWIWRMSDKDLKELAEDTKAMSLLGDRLSAAISEYVSHLDEVAEMENDAFASLLDLDYDSFYSDFVSMVSDMDSTSAEFANNFAGYMRNALVKNLIASKYKGSIERLYKMAGEYAQNGELENHLLELKESFQNMAENAKKEVDLISQITGFDENLQENGTSGGWTTISEETGTALNGRFAALQIAGENVSSQMNVAVAQLMAVGTSLGEGNAYLNDLLAQQVIANSYLEDVVKYSRAMYQEWGTRIQSIDNSLK